MPKILIAEDDLTMVSLLKTLLKLEGFEVVNLDVNADILTAIVRELPDVILMDVHLGEKSGVEVVASLRKKPEFEQVRIVMTSGMDLKDECLNQGADHFLLKPFMPDDLIKILNN
ncbi:MAG: response regulator [Anaerolineales bacterium]|nr:response regulator [Anaerolineales bacterium]